MPVIGTVTGAARPDSCTRPTSVTYQVPAAGSYPVTIRYANSLGGQSPPYQNVTRTISIAAGGQTQPVSLPVTGSRDTWSTVNVDLPTGDDAVELLVTANDSGSVNVDSITVGTP